MLLELIARYYKFLWMALAIVAFFKIILAYSFHGNLQGFNGVIYALFKWYGEEEQELEDFGPRRTMMRLHNVITLIIYGLFLAIIAAIFLLKLGGR